MTPKWIGRDPDSYEAACENCEIEPVPVWRARHGAEDAYVCLDCLTHHDWTVLAADWWSH